MSRGVRWLLIVLGVLLVLFLVYLFVFFGPPGYAERIARPTFCASCHNMKDELAAFERGPHSDLESCNDCHLPNRDPVSHYAWDAVVGARDLVDFNLGRFSRQPANTRATDRTRTWIQDNCIRCHSRVVQHAGLGVAGRLCWSCHREMYHRLSGREREVPSGGLDFGWSIEPTSGIEPPSR